MPQKNETKSLAERMAMESLSISSQKKKERPFKNGRDNLVVTFKTVDNRQ